MSHFKDLRIRALGVPGLVAPANGLGARPAVVVYSYNPGERKHRAPDTSAAGALRRSTGNGTRPLDRTWGYNDAGIWIS